MDAPGGTGMLGTKLGPLPIVAWVGLAGGAVAIALAMRSKSKGAAASSAATGGGGVNGAGIDMLAPSAAEAFGTLQNQQQTLQNQLGQVATTADVTAATAPTSSLGTAVQGVSTQVQGVSAQVADVASNVVAVVTGQVQQNTALASISDKLAQAQPLPDVWQLGGNSGFAGAWSGGQAGLTYIVHGGKIFTSTGGDTGVTSGMPDGSSASGIGPLANATKSALHSLAAG